MPTMTFRVPAGLPAPVLDDFPLCTLAGGHDRAPTLTEVQLRNEHLVLGREINESAPANVPWEIASAGRLITPTTTLMFRERPYQLAVELARGKINQVRNQYAEWQAGGLNACSDIEELLARATTAFAAAVLADPPADGDHRAEESLAAAFEAADVLVRRYQEQVLWIRHQRQSKFDSALGCRIAAVPPRGLDDVFRLAFNAACIPLTWGQIEPIESDYRWADADAAIAWAADRNLRVFAGPLVDFSEAGLPEYVRRLHNDSVSLKSLMCDYVETVVTRYRSKVSRWLITAGANGTSALGLSEEDLIRLTAMVADAVWQIDPNLQLVFGISRPWGDYLSSPGFDYSPFVYADTLLRAGLPFAGVEVEWFLGTSPRGSYCRDLLESSRLLDLFGLLGVPVQVSLAYPSSAQSDPQADGTERVGVAGRWRDFSPAAQADWAGEITSLAMCKSFVSGVFWNHLSDADPHCIPNAGLVDARGSIKPAFDRLRNLRESHLR